MSSEGKKREDISESGAVDGVRSPQSSPAGEPLGTVRPDQAQVEAGESDYGVEGSNGGGNLYGNPVRGPSTKE